MNVMHVVLNLEVGGLEHIVIQLAKRMEEYNITPKIVCLGEMGDLAQKAKEQGIEVFALKKKPGFDIKLILDLARLFRKEKIQLVHTHNPAPLIYGTLAAVLSGKKCINTRHGNVERTVSRWIWRFNRSAIAVSEDAKEKMLKCNRINKDKVKVIYNGIVVEEKHISHDLQFNSEMKRSLGLKENSFVVGTVGRLSPEKDQASLIKAFRKLVRKEADAELVIVGDGQLRLQLEQMVNDYEIQKNVKFLGFRQDVDEIIKIFDVFVLSSYQEGLSISILEAMRAGKPVVATKVGGNPEVVSDKLTGAIVPCGFPERIENALMRFFINKHVAAEMGLAGRERVQKKFSLEHMAIEYLKVYKNVLGKRDE